MKTAINDACPEVSPERVKEPSRRGHSITAGPDAPQTATCPDCGAEVHLRKRKRMDGTTTYFYRHAHGQGQDCPRRYRPTR